MKRGEIVGLIGPNGAGKTTLFGMVTGFLKPTAGKVYFRGADITGCRRIAAVCSGLFARFRRPQSFPTSRCCRRSAWASIAKQVLACSMRCIATHDTGAKRAQPRSAQRKSWIFVGLGACADQRAGSLSYGQQRLVELAIALAADPELLLLDEPAAGLNPTESAELVNVIRAVRDRGTTVFLVEHDMSVIMEVCDRIYVIAFGEKIAEGRPEEIQENEAVIEAYLGSAHVAA